MGTRYRCGTFDFQPWLVLNPMGLERIKIRIKFVLKKMERTIYMQHN